MEKGNNKANKRKFTAVSLFCGAGGMDIGFENAGFQTIWANDFDADACNTHSMWSSADVVCGNIGNIAEDHVPDADIFLGGFPCQGFSLSGPRRLDDSRNTLYRHYVRLVRAKQPLMFVGENVKGLLTMGGGQVIEAIVDSFASCGYRVFYKLVNAKDYGVPQDRERVILAGFRMDLGIGQFEFPAPSGKRVTMREALQGVPSPEPGEVCMQPYSSRYMSRNRKRGWDDVGNAVPCKLAEAVGACLYDVLSDAV